MTGIRNKTYGRNENLRFTEGWIENRMRIFMNFTRKSLEKQTNQDFTALYVYEDSTEELINHALPKYSHLPENIRFIKKTEYNSAIDSLTTGYDELYLTRLDSDDMYANTFIQKLHDYKPKEETEALLCQYGYIYDCINKRLGEYYHYQFTFYTFIYKLNKEGKKFSSLNITPWDVLVNFSHQKIIDYKYESIPERNFIFNIHTHNTDSIFGIYDWGNCKVEREILDKVEIGRITSDFF